MSFTVLYALVSLVLLAAVLGLALWLRGFRTALIAGLLTIIILVAGYFGLVALAIRNM